MRKNNKKGFTLVELLAVIAVLSIILVIAVPIINNVIEESRKRTLELSVKSIARSAEEAYLENESSGITDEITCESVANISRNEYESCQITFDSAGNASVTYVGKGSYDGLYVCKGTKTLSQVVDICPSDIKVQNITGGIVTLDKTEAFVGETVTLNSSPESGYTYDGAIVAYKDENGVNQELVLNSDELTFAMTTGAANVTPKWELNTYSITYNVDGGTNPSGVVTSYNVTTDTITLPTPTKTGYTFDGWYTITGKNLFGNGDLSISNAKAVTLKNQLPAGTYTISAVVTSTDTDASTCLIGFLEGKSNGNNVNILLSRGERSSATFTLENVVTQVRFNSGRNYDLSSGDKSTFTDIQIEAGSVATAYEPYTEPVLVTKIAKGSTGDKYFFAKWTPNN